MGKVDWLKPWKWGKEPEPDKGYIKTVKVLDDNYVEATIITPDGKEWRVRVRRRPTFPPT